METNFSFHAYKRVYGRLSISHITLAKILDNDLVVNIGEEPNTNRLHKLFYSEPDKICFVAIQDIKVGTVITTLPIDYHENISWAVSIESQSQAKNLIVKRNETTSNNEIEVTHSNPSVFRISASITDDYGNYIKNINLGSWPCEPYNHSINALVQDESFINYLAVHITEKITDNIDTQFIHAISIRLGSRGQPVLFATPNIAVAASA
ncbi:MAG: hypothetical protein ACJAS1_007239 [Oleiphilaceae bacterium]|jgi:hypothetical protein